jgi:hypothetical protein
MPYEVVTAMIMKISIIWYIAPDRLLKSVDVSEEHVASIFGVKI